MPRRSKRDSEGEQRLEVRFGLAGEADDERGSERHPGDALAQLRH
jgi:hypothetical protein